MTSDEMPVSRGTAIVVLGMHRSATSILTRALHVRGCTLSSDLLGANASNPSGHWESRVAIDIDDQLLHALGRTWDDPRELPQGWMSGPEAMEARRRIRIMLGEDFKRTKLWAIKEPRMCRLAPLWIDEITRMGFEVKVVMAVRHPYEVALSLLRRDGLPTAQGLMLWARHLLEAEAATRNLTRLVIEHGEITDDWRSAMRRIETQFDISWPVSEEVAGVLLDSVISPSSVNINKAISGQGLDADSAPDICIDLYRCALDTSIDAGAWARFAMLSKRFAEYSKLYEPVLDSIFRRCASLDGEAIKVEALHAKEAHAEIVRTVLEKLDSTTELKMQAVRLLELEDQLSSKSVRVEDLERWLNDKEERIHVMDDELAARTANIQVLESALYQKQVNIDGLNVQINSMQAGIDAALMLEKQLADSIKEQKRHSVELNAELLRMRQSHSWRLTSPLRTVAFFLRRFTKFAANSIKATSFLVGDPSKMRPIVSRAKQEGVFSTVQRAVAFAGRGGPRDLVQLAAAPRLVLRSVQEKPVVILTTPHCLYIAHLMVNALQRAGIPAKTIQGEPADGYDDVPHFVICPQMFKRLPGMYVAFQMEQSVSSRWFTDEYIATLQNSFAILDYSIENISYLDSLGVSRKQVYYLPVGYLVDHTIKPAPEEDYDVVFYGDVNCERRQEFLAALRKKFSVKIISEVFGEELARELSRARVVVNIHYYPGALLETTRIWECLSLGRMVVSEASVDMERHPDLEGAVDFVDIGDVQAMVDRVEYWLENEQARRQMVAANSSRFTRQASRFDYFFYRFLLATDNISFDDFWLLAGNRLELPVDRICLNLPEYTERAEDFQKDNQFGFWCFPGLRHSQGWLGCAMSYKLMIMLARQQGMPMVSICEDDVDFCADFEQKLQKVHEYLNQLGDGWDVFSGLMADFNPEAHISGVADQDGLRYVHIDKLISTVFNVYSAKVFDIIANWDEGNLEVKSNTIDRYLEGRNCLRVVTTDPFLVGHKEDHHSTIWGFKNTQYNDLISSSNHILRAKVTRFLEGAA